MRRVAPDGTVGPRMPAVGAGRATSGPSRVALASRRAARGRSPSWAERTADGIVTDVFARRLGADGTPLGRRWRGRASERPLGARGSRARADGATRPAVAYEPSLGAVPRHLGSPHDATVGGPRSSRAGWTPAGAPIDAGRSRSPGGRRPCIGPGPRRPRWSATRRAARGSSRACPRGGWTTRRPTTSSAGAAAAVDAIRPPGPPEARVDDPPSGIGPPALAAGPRGHADRVEPGHAHDARRRSRAALGTGPDPGVADHRGRPGGRIVGPRRDAHAAARSRAPARRSSAGSTRASWERVRRRVDLDRARRTACTASRCGRSGRRAGWSSARAPRRPGASRRRRRTRASPRLADPFSVARFEFAADETATSECRVDERSVALVRGARGRSRAARSRTGRTVRGPRHGHLRPARGDPGASRLDDRHALARDDDPRRPARRERRPVGRATSSSRTTRRRRSSASGRRLRFEPCRSGERMQSRTGVIDVRARDASGRRRRLAGLLALGVPGRSAARGAAGVHPRDERLGGPEPWTERWNTLECRADDRPWQRCDGITRLDELAPGKPAHPGAGDRRQRAASARARRLIADIALVGDGGEAPVRGPAR